MTQLRTRVDPVTGVVVEDPPIRDFASTMLDLGNGKTNKEMSEALWDLIDKVTQTGKKGTLSLTLTVEPMSKADGGPVTVKDEIKLRPPEFPRIPTVAYVDENGNLSRNNPYQPEIEGLKTIPDNQRNVRSI